MSRPRIPRGLRTDLSKYIVADGAQAPVQGGQHVLKGRLFSRAEAKALAFLLLEEKVLTWTKAERAERLQIATATAIPDFWGHTKEVVAGIKRAFASRGIAIDYECAEGIAEAVQEIFPRARDNG